MKNLKPNHDMIMLVMIMKPTEKRCVRRIPPEAKPEPRWPALHPRKNACPDCGMLVPCHHHRACKYCGAKAGRPCVSVGGNYSSYPHTSRVTPRSGCGCVNATQRCHLHR